MYMRKAKGDLWIILGVLIIMTGKATYDYLRGWRNNNPGNIRLTGTHWLGMSDKQTDGVFVQFQTATYGIRAMAVILKNYQDRHGIRTLGGVISRCRRQAKTLPVS